MASAAGSDVISIRRAVTLWVVHGDPPDEIRGRRPVAADT